MERPNCLGSEIADRGQVCLQTPSPVYLLFSLLLVGVCSAFTKVDGQDLPIEPAKLDRADPVDFVEEILPLFKRNCLACHHRKEAEGGLVVESYADLIKGGDAGPGIVPNDVDASYVFARASGLDEPLMPPEGNSVGAETLTPQELAILQLWIQQGAPGGEGADSESIQWHSLPSELQPVYALASSPDGRYIASGKANQVVIYEASTMQQVSQLADSELSTNERAVAGRDIVQSIAFSPDGNTIATGGFRTVRLWRRAEGHLATAETPFANAAGLIAANSDRSSIALVNAIGDIEIWSANERKHTLQGHAETIRGLAWASDAERLFSVDDAGTLLVWEPTSGKRIAEVETNHTPSGFAASTDGNHVVLADIQGKVHVWAVAEDAEGDAEGPALQLVPRTDAGENEALKTLLETTNATAVAFSPNPATQLAVANEAGKVSIVDLAAGSLIRTIDHGRPIRAIAIGGEPLRLVTAGGDGTNRLWNFQSGEAVAELGDDPDLLRDLAAAKQDADRQTALVKSRTDQKTELEKVAESEAEALAKLKETRDEAAEALKAEEKKVEDATAAAAETDAMIKQTEQAIAEAKKERETAEQELAKAEESANEPAEADEEADEGDKEAKEKLAAVKARIESANQQTTELAAKLKTQQTELETRSKAVSDAEAAQSNSQQELAKRQQAFDSAEQANNRAAAALPEQDRLIALEQRRSDALQQRMTEIEATLAASRRPFVAAAIDGDQGQKIVMARADGTVRVFRIEDGTAIDQFQIDSVTPHGLLMTGEERLLVFGTDGPAQQWSMKPRWELQQRIGGADDSLISDRVTALDFHPDGHAVAVGSGPPSRFGEIKIFAVHNGQMLREWGEIHSDTVFGVQFSPDGRRLASSAADKTIRVLDIVSGNEIRSLEGHTHHVLALAWQDDGQVIASASADQTVKVWDVESGEQKRTINGFPKEITALTFVGSTTQIATACADGNVRLHDANNGKAIRSFNASGDFLFTTALADEGKTLVAGGQSGVLRSWTLSDGKLVHETP